ncbi:hypothetical protein A2U01_0052980, partial [Trifolium medium]|nr:hypothetical protein [Trifolium medium]
MITFLEFNIFSPLIMITLLTTLRHSHLLPNHPNLLGSLLHNLQTKNYTFSEFIPTKRCPTPPLIQSFKRCHSNTRMETIV